MGTQNDKDLVVCVLFFNTGRDKTWFLIICE